MNYNDFYSQSISNPEEFWKNQAKNIDWFKEPTQILSKNKNGYPQWFADGELNACYLCLDKHIEEGYGDELALIYDSPVTQQIKKFTYNEVKSEVAKLAGGLQSLGVKKGDTVIIYMPMISKAVFAMLACARIGAIHSVVFGGFAPSELATRIDDCKPKVIITASSGIEIDRLIAYKPFVDEAIEIAEHKPEHVVVFNRKLGARVPFKKYDIDYDALIYGSEEAACEIVNATHPLYILYTSGTTGKPKGIVRDTGGYVTALKNSMSQIYDLKPGDVFWTASDVGWVVGHSYIVYAPFLNRTTTIVFEGKPIKTPDASTFWRVINEHKVNVMFTAPTAIRAIKKEDPNGEFIKKYDLSSLKLQFLAGERSDIASIDWYKSLINVPVIDHCWQTETGWPMLANMAGIELLPYKPGSAGKAVVGYNIKIFNESGEDLGPNKEGFIVAKLPLPPGTLAGLWNNEKRFEESYLKQFPGYYFTGDGGYHDEDGNVWVTGRVDDVINVAGHRLSTSEMEEIVSQHQEVAECAVVGIEDTLKGQIPVAFVILKNNSEIEHFQLQYEIVPMVRNKIGAIAALKNCIVIDKLPKTRSGKTLRKLIRDIVDGKDYQIPSTIEDETCIPHIIETLEHYKIGSFK